MIIGADIPAYGYEGLILSLLELTRRNFYIDLYLASRRNKYNRISPFTLIQNMGITDRVHYYPYYETVKEFPIFKSDCDYWVPQTAEKILTVDNVKAQNDRPRLLYIAPTHPFDNHGNAFAQRWFLKRFKEAGFYVSLILYTGCPYKEEWNEELKKLVEDFHVLPVENQFPPLYEQGQNIEPDVYCGIELMEYVKEVTRRQCFDICFVNYVVFSALFQVIPSYTKKIIQTHDILADRNLHTLENKYPDIFWQSLRQDDEVKTVGRSDIAIGISRNDSAKLKSYNTTSEIMTVVPLPDRQNLIAPHNEKLTIGYLGSNNPWNEHNLREFLNSVVKNDFVRNNCKFRIAGGICADADLFLPQELKENLNLEIKGIVKNTSDFYADCDLLINPEKGGTGIKIKTLEALAHGKPFISLKGASVGLGTNNSMHTLNTMQEMTDAIETVAKKPDLLKDLAALSRQLFQKLEQENIPGLSSILVTAQTCLTPQFVSKNGEAYIVPFRNLLRHLDVKNKVIAEVGSDHLFAMARLCLANGAKKFIANNLNPWPVDDNTPENLEFQQCDFIDAKIPPHSVDLIIGNAVLEHIVDYEAMLAKFREILKPDGKIFMEGNPFWTSSLGHHLFVFINGKPLYRFDDNNVIVNWSHLALTPDEMKEHLKTRVPDPEHRKAIVNMIYDSSNGYGSNKLAPSDIVRSFKKYFYTDVEREYDYARENRFYRKAKEKYDETDLRIKGMVLTARPKVFIPSRESGQAKINVIFKCESDKCEIDDSMACITGQNWKNMEILCFHDQDADEDYLAIQDARIIPVNYGKSFSFGSAIDELEHHSDGIVLFVSSTVNLANRDVIDELVTPILNNECQISLGEITNLPCVDKFTLLPEHRDKGEFFAGEQAFEKLFQEEWNREGTCWKVLAVSREFLLEAKKEIDKASYSEFMFFPLLIKHADKVWKLNRIIGFYKTGTINSKSCGFEKNDILKAFEEEYNLFPQAIKENIIINYLLDMTERMGQENIETGEAIEVLIHILDKIQTQIPQKQFNQLYSRIRHLFHNSAVKTESLNILLAKFNIDNLGAFYHEQ